MAHRDVASVFPLNTLIKLYFNYQYRCLWKIISQGNFVRHPIFVIYIFHNNFQLHFTRVARQVLSSVTRPLIRPISYVCVVSTGRTPNVILILSMLISYQHCLTQTLTQYRTILVTPYWQWAVFDMTTLPNEQYPSWEAPVLNNSFEYRSCRLCCFSLFL